MQVTLINIQVFVLNSDSEILLAVRFHNFTVPFCKLQGKVCASGNIEFIHTYIHTLFSSLLSGAFQWLIIHQLLRLLFNLN